MGGYWYFVSTLPTLQLGGTAPWSREAFLALCARNLAASDLEVIKGLVLVSEAEGAPPSGGLALLEEYYRWERSLRDELALLRAAKLGFEAPRRHEDEAKGREVQAVALMAFHAPTPLEGELIVERARWAFLDSLAPIRTFDLETVAAWYLKLLSLERLGLFAEEPGEAGYRAMYRDIMEGWRSRPAPSTSERPEQIDD